MSEEQIIISNNPQMIEVLPLTLIATAPGCMDKISYPQRIEISSMTTLHHAGLVKKLHEAFPLLWDLLQTSNRLSSVPKPDPDEIRRGGTGFLHLMGLLDLSLKFIDMGVPFAWVHPESHLHPATQAVLADILILLTSEDDPELSLEERLTSANSLTRVGTKYRMIRDTNRKQYQELRKQQEELAKQNKIDVQKP